MPSMSRYAMEFFEFSRKPKEVQARDLDYSDDDHIAWMEHNRQIVDENGEMTYMSFNDRVFFVEIVNECFEPRSITVLMKGRQIGASEMVITRAHEIAFKRPNTAITHTQNDFDAMQRFINQKMNPLYNTVEFSRMLKSVAKSQERRKGKSRKSWREQQAAVNTRTDKEFVNGSMYTLLYIKDEAAAKSQTYRNTRTDMLLIDEFGDVQEGQLIPLQEGTSASGLRIIFYLGTPKLQYSKFQEMYLEMSDQRNWFIKCPLCGLEQKLIDFNDWRTWDSHIMEREVAGAGDSVAKEHYFGCEKCHAELDRKAGRWVPLNPGAPIRGYYIPQLLAPWVSADEFLFKFKTSTGHERTTFIREVLGIPYSGEDAPIREEWLEACIDPTVTRQVKVKDGVACLGVDWGLRSNSHCGLIYPFDDKMIISDIWQIRNEILEEHTRHIIRTLDALPTFIACMDFGFGVGQNQVIMPKYPGRAWAVISSNSKEIVSWNTSRGSGSGNINYHVTINHTAIVEDVAALFQNRVFRFPGMTEEDVAWSRSQFPMIMRVERVIKDKGTGERMSYTTTRAHSFCALMYAYIATLRAGTATVGGTETVAPTGLDHIPGISEFITAATDDLDEYRVEDPWGGI